MPYGLRLEKDGEDFLILEPAGRSLAGELTIPSMSGRNLVLSTIRIPSNGRFNQTDLRHLWDAGSELSTWRSARQALARRDGGFGRPDIAGPAPEVRDWQSLVTCARDASVLLTRWPSVLDRAEMWHPVGIPVGVEDLFSTERQAEQRGHTGEINGDVVLTHSARSLGVRRARTSPNLSALSQAVIQLVHESLPPAERRWVRPLLLPLATVANRAMAPAGTHELGPSSWPRAFTDFAGSCVRVLADLQSARRGTGVVPFLDADELYEAWLATQVRREFDSRFGQWKVPSSGALASWLNDDIHFELWVKPAIGRRGLLIGTARFFPVVAETLAPDLLVSARRGEVTEVAILDAKSWASMQPEDALAQSAKYLYGLRRADDPDAVPAFSGVDLVTCAARPSVSDVGLSRVNVTSATPTRGVDVLGARLIAIVHDLRAALSDRERAVSTTA